MRKSRYILALSFLAAVVWLGAQLNQPRAAENGKPAVQKWEYKVFTNDIGDNIAINQFGADGWELCGYSQSVMNGSQFSTAIFKRPKQ
jgi:hypothetical protein